MRGLGDQEIMELWERGQRLSPVDRALAILASGERDLGIDDLARLSVGQRDARLLRLRARTFGSRVTGLADCPDCSERLDIAFFTDDLLGTESFEREITVSDGDYYARARPPNSLDLLDVLQDEWSGDIAQRLLSMCVLEAKHCGAALAAGSLPSHVTDAIERRIAEADPNADIRLALECPQCGNRWQKPFDIVSFFWSEIHTRALRLLHEVHRLAFAYGWSEADILKLGPWRHRAYLEILGQ